MLGSASFSKKKKKSRGNHASKFGVWPLEQWNACVEKSLHEPIELPAEIWDHWLWHTNPQEAPSAEHPLNLSHLLGLLLCRHRAATCPSENAHVPFACKELKIVDRPISLMTLRELKDTVSNVALQWGKQVQTLQNSSPTQKFLDMCFQRFGEFCWAAWEVGHENNPIQDDMASIEKVDDTQYQQLTFSCIRNMLNTFLILYRLLFWQEESMRNEDEWLEKNEVENSKESTKEQIMPIEKHHVQASLDYFYKLAMFYDLMPAARLNYMHNFNGLYNCISQPAYFHNPNYERRIQLSLEEVRDGKHDIHTLPALLQMYPQIIVLYEDDDLPTKVKQAEEKQIVVHGSCKVVWAWMVTASQRIYLLRWDVQEKSHTVFFHRKNQNIIDLVNIYFLPWHKKDLEKQCSQQISGLTSNAQTTSQNQIMTLFRLKYATKTGL